MARAEDLKGSHQQHGQSSNAQHEDDEQLRPLRTHRKGVKRGICTECQGTNHWEVTITCCKTVPRGPSTVRESGILIHGQGLQLISFRRWAIWRHHFGRPWVLVTILHVDGHHRLLTHSSFAHWTRRITTARHQAAMKR